MKKQVAASESKQNVHILSTESVDEAVKRLTAGGPCKKLVINGLFDKNYLYRELNKAAENQESLCIVIDQKTVGHDFKGLKNTPPMFAGLDLDKHQIIIVPKNHRGSTKVVKKAVKTAGSDCQYTIKPSPQWAEHLIENHVLAVALQLEQNITLNHFEISAVKQQQFKEAIAIRVGVSFEKVEALLHFEKGMMQAGKAILRTLEVVPESTLEDPKINTIVVNQQTVQHLAQQISVKKEGGKLGIKGGLLEEMPDAVLVIESPLDEYGEYLLAEAMRKRPRQSIKLSEWPFETTQTADVGLALADVSPDQAVIIEAHSEMGMSDLLGHLEISDKEKKQGKFDGEASPFVKELREKKSLAVVDRGQNPSFMKALKTLKGNPPYLYLYGQKVEFEGLEVRVIKEDKRMTKPRFETLINKAIEAQPAKLKDELSQAQIRAEINRVCEVLPAHQRSFVGVRKLIRQIGVEKNYDKAQQLDAYHVKKAASSVLKELKLSHREYEDKKKALWGEGGDAPKTADAKVIEDALFIELHDGLLKDVAFQSTFKGLGELQLQIRQFQTEDTYIDIVVDKILEVVLTPVASLKQQLTEVLLETKTSAEGSESKRATNKLKRKDIRSEFKLRAHGLLMMLGPTGSGKTEAAKRLNERLNHGATEGLLQVNVGMAKGMPEIMGSEKQQRSEDGKIVSKFEAGLIQSAMQRQTIEGGAIENPIIVIDEATMIENWDMMALMLSMGHTWINGEKVSPGLIYMTGNEAGGGSYGGRKTDLDLTRHGMVMKRSKMSAKELVTYIVDPELSKIEDLSVASQTKISQVVEATLEMLEEECGLTGDELGARELKDLVAKIRKRLDPKSTETVTDYQLGGEAEIVFQCVYELTAGLVGKTKIARLHEKLNDIFEEKNFGFEEDNLNKRSKVELLKERAGYIKEGVLGIKPGVILDYDMLVKDNDDGEIKSVRKLSSLVMAEVLEEVHGKSPQRLCYECEAQWPELRAAIEAAYAAGQPIIIEEADKIPGDLLESVTNDLLNEAKAGFGIYFVASEGVEIQQSFNPSQLSRLCQIEDSYFTFEQAEEILDGSDVSSALELENDLQDVATVRDCLIGSFYKFSSAVSGLICTLASGLKKLGLGRFSTSNSYKSGFDIDTKSRHPVARRAYSNESENRLRRENVLKMDESFKIQKLTSEFKEVSVKRKLNISNPVNVNVVFNRKGRAVVPTLTGDLRITGYSTQGGDLKFFKDKNNLWQVQRQGIHLSRSSTVSLETTHGRLDKALMAENSRKNSPFVREECSQKFIQQMDELLDKKNEDGKKTTRENLGIRERDSDSVKIRKIFNYVNSFESKLVPMTTLMSTELGKLEHLMTHKVGVCRHQAWVAAALLKYFGIQAVLEGNDTHMWIALKLTSPFLGQTHVIFDVNTVREILFKDNMRNSDLDGCKLENLEKYEYKGQPLLAHIKKLGMKTRTSPSAGEFSATAFSEGADEWFTELGVEVVGLKTVLLESKYLDSNVADDLTEAGIRIEYVDADAELSQYDSMDYLHLLTEDDVLDKSVTPAEVKEDAGGESELIEIFELKDDVGYWMQKDMGSTTRLSRMLKKETDPVVLLKILDFECMKDKNLWLEKDFLGRASLMQALQNQTDSEVILKILDLDFMKDNALWLEKDILGYTSLMKAFGYQTNSEVILKILDLDFMKDKALWLEKDGLENTILMKALQKQTDPEVILKILDFDCMKDKALWLEKDFLGYTSLMKAFDYQTNSEVILKILDLDFIKNKLFWMEKDDRGWTPLMLALLYQKDPQVMLKILDLDFIKNKLFWMEKDDRGITPLMLALRSQTDPEVILKILDLEFVKNKLFWMEKEDVGWTPLMYAVLYQTDPQVMLKVLDLEFIKNKLFWMKKDDRGWTPLMYALRYQTDPQVMLKILDLEFLQKEGFGTEGNTSGDTPESIAKINQKDKKVKAKINQLMKKFKSETL